MTYRPGTLMLATGETFTTTSGRATAPFPKADLTTERRTANTITRARAWLLSEARAELEHRGRPRIEYLLTGVGTASVKNWTQAEGDSFEAMLADPDYWTD